MGRNGGAQETLFLIRNIVKDTSTEAVIVQESLWKSNLAKTKPPLLHPKRLQHRNSLWSLVILTGAMPVHQVTAASPSEVNISILPQILYLTTGEGIHIFILCIFIASCSYLIYWFLQNRVRNPQGVSIYPSTVSLQAKESPVIQQKHRNNNNPFEFGHISSDSLLNPNSAKTYGSSYLDFSSNQDKHSVNHNHNSWPEELKSDWTQLSMSIPIASSSPSSAHNNNNNAQDKTTLSPLRLSRELDLSIQTEETALEPAVKKVNTWIPISWGNSLGGPLGEVLNSTTNSPTLGSSPTGVLQKSTFCSLSNNSSASSPIAENNNRNNGDYFHYTTWKLKLSPAAGTKA